MIYGNFGVTILSEELLQRFVMSSSQEAFAGLVSRHSEMIYATALRRVNGATGMAEDVTQKVFNLLAKKAKSLAGTGCPAGWLYRQTCYLAANEMRTESRRKKREEVAIEMMSLHEDGLPGEVVRELDDLISRIQRLGKMPQNLQHPSRSQLVQALIASWQELAPEGFERSPYVKWVDGE